jgi:hypothetical protein
VTYTDAQKARDRRYREHHLEEIRARGRLRYAQNPERVHDKNKRYYAKNKQRENIRCKIYEKTHPVTITCKQCGGSAQVSRKDVWFCSKKCQGIYFSGERSPVWRGGISFEPYCRKFSPQFKERVRGKFNHRCYLCPKDEVDNGEKLCVHHIDYNKNSLCNGREWAFVPLCRKCHAKTNFDRWYWFNRLIYYWLEKYDLSFEI